MNKKVIYTAIFGDTHYLHDPEVISQDYDYICFTDSNQYKSNIWDVRKVTPLYTHGGLNNRKYKVLPHRFLSNYDFSIYVDGDLKITSDLNNLSQNFESNPLSVLDHSLCGVNTTGNLNSRNCIYDEANFIKWLGDNHPRKHYKDNIDTIFKQMERYQIEKYPSKNGLARTSMIMRNHNNTKVIRVMEDWWLELKHWSKRDQLSFPYVCWKNNFNISFISEDIDSNKWVKLLKKWRTKQNKLPKTSKFQPISLDYFLDMEIANGGPSKQILNLNGKLKKVKDIVNYWKDKNNINNIDINQDPANLQYLNCMLAGFRKNVENHHDIGWDKLTAEYYNNLESMSNKELEDFLKSNPVEFDNGFIKHSYHRAYAMIGRLIRNEKYIPFYMETTQIYSKPRQHDNIHRTKPLTDKINLLKQLDKMGINKEDYCLTQSSILSIMGIRDNDDLDIIISSKLRKQIPQFPTGIEVFSPNRKKFSYFGAKDDDDLLNNYCIEIEGYKFLEPRFYFARKHINNTQRDISDWTQIRNFFNKDSHKGYPFNFNKYKWGTYLTAKRIDLKDIDVSKFLIIRDKYTRVVNGVNQGRIMYYDEENKQYIKIFHPEYCRLSNFEEALKSGILNGVCSSLVNLIYDKNKLIGYICEEGEVLSTNEFDYHLIPQFFIETIARNCKQRNKIFYDLVPSNIIKTKEGQLSLIDLESVYDLDDENSLINHNAKIKPENLKEIINKI